MDYAALSWRDVEQLDEDTIFFLSVSPMEAHGPHLPLGTDFYVARAVEQRTMQRLEAEHSVVSLPSLPLGACRMARDFPGSMSMDWRTLRDVLVEQFSLVADVGSYLMVLSFHMDLHHVKAVHAAMQKTRGLTICEPLSPHFFRGTLWPSADEGEVHADMKETSLGLALFPELVRDWQEQPPVHVDLDGPAALYHTMRELGAEQGYVGSPSKATREYGDAFFERMTDICVDAAEAMLTGDELPGLPARIRLLLRFVR
jgi:creatinine amidohydrolase